MVMGASMVDTISSGDMLNTTTRGEIQAVLGDEDGFTHLDNNKQEFKDLLNDEVLKAIKRVRNFEKEMSGHESKADS